MDANIARKIRALLKKAEGTQFEEEANAFLRKAQELMMRHGIDEERLWATDPSRRHKIETIKINIPDNKSGAMSKRLMLSAIAQVNHCNMFYTPGKGESTVAGYPNDLLFVEMLYTSIVKQMSFKEAMALAHSSTHHKTFRANFSEAYAGRISERLFENYRLAKQTISNETPGTAIALVDRKQEVDDWVRSKYRIKSSSSSGSSGRYDSGARAAGRSAAETTDISGGRGGKLGSGKKALNA